MLKMYIAVLDEVPDHMVPVLVAHATLGAHLEWYQPNVSNLEHEEQYSFWLTHSFRKVVLRVNQKEFNKIAELPNVYAAHENSTLEGVDSCIVVCPREEIPNVLKYAKMWKPA